MTRPAFRPILTASAAALLGVLILHLLPALELGVFARGAARIAGCLAGTAVQPSAEGWLLSGTAVPVAVTAACSATDFYLMLVTLIAWQLGRRSRPVWFALPAALLAALPLDLLVNALRIVAVAAAHRWLIPRLPDAYGPFLHMLTGAVIFLTSLMLLNLLLERHGHPRPLRA